jgi:membrane-bound ClpP family serine protease
VAHQKGLSFAPPGSRECARAHANRNLESSVIALGIILLVIGILVKSIHFLIVIGAILLVIGLILAALGMMGRAIGGRRHYF